MGLFVLRFALGEHRAGLNLNGRYWPASLALGIRR